ncbi:golgin subfamily A member 6-like protein 6 [Sesamum indicum]|uniref:Golgin subfamily A member 6-like protein 6 n=1 Tax=Sesamum indicum TaxID=4182 RepID=A0A6I9T0X9_SESIN|nr:golgin subfamily A member 6-like protein 6 [Sesamum indicum]
MCLIVWDSTATATTTMRKSTVFTRLFLLRQRVHSTSPKYLCHPLLSTHTVSNPLFTAHTIRNYSVNFSDLPLNSRLAAEARALQDLTYQVQQERAREREERIKAGLDTADLDAEEEEDYMGVGPLIEKLEKEKAKGEPRDLNRYEEQTDSDSDDDDRFSKEAENKLIDQFEKKFKKHEELLDNFTKAETLDDAFKWMKRIDKFEEKHFQLRPEYRVIGELMNRLKVAEGKEKFLLQVKLNRALRMVEWKDAFDPNDPANYGVIQHEQVGSSVDHVEHADLEKEQETTRGERDADDLEFDDLKEKDNILLEKLNELDKKLEQKLAELDHTFGKKGKLLEEEIRDLAEERNSLTEQKRKPLYRKGFDVKLIDVNRTCKVTKGGQVVKYTAMLACGNYHGVVGFAKAKGPAIPVALQKAYEKCFQNLHYIERHEEHTIAHAIQTSYKKTKVYLWPAPTQTGMKAGRTVQTVLSLAGFKNVKSKVVGSRNPHNTVKALFKALNAIETPKDVQEKFGRTVVESYLL